MFVSFLGFVSTPTSQIRYRYIYTISLRQSHFVPSHFDQCVMSNFRKVPPKKRCIFCLLSHHVLRLKEKTCRYIDKKMSVANLPHFSHFITSMYIINPNLGNELFYAFSLAWERNSKTLIPCKEISLVWMIEEEMIIRKLITSDMSKVKSSSEG